MHKSTSSSSASPTQLEDASQESRRSKCSVSRQSCLNKTRLSFFALLPPVVFCHMNFA